MFALLLLFLTSSIAIVGKRPIETPPDTSTFDVSQSIPANKVPQEQALHQHKRSNARQIVVEEKVRKHVPNLHRKISQPIGLQATPGAIPENVSPRPRQISRTYVDEVPTGVEEQYDVSQSAPGEYAPTEQAFVQEEVSGGDLSEAEYEQALKQIPGEETK